jgi:hypothetical protein
MEEKIVQIFQELGKKGISPYELYDLMNDIEVNWQKILMKLIDCYHVENDETEYYIYEKDILSAIPCISDLDGSMFLKVEYCQIWYEIVNNVLDVVK